MGIRLAIRSTADCFLRKSVGQKNRVGRNNESKCLVLHRDLLPNCCQNFLKLQPKRLSIGLLLLVCH